MSGPLFRSFAFVGDSLDCAIPVDAADF